MHHAKVTTEGRGPCHRPDELSSENRRGFSSTENEISNQPDALKDDGYLAIDLFTDALFPACSIYDSIAPDALHQAAKNFYDQVYTKWRKLGVIKLDINEANLAAVDARFRHVPAYPGLRWFRSGISKIKR